MDGETDCIIKDSIEILSYLEILSALRALGPVANECALCIHTRTRAHTHTRTHTRGRKRRRQRDLEAQLVVLRFYLSLSSLCSHQRSICSPRVRACGVSAVYTLTLTHSHMSICAFVCVGEKESIHI